MLTPNNNIDNERERIDRNLREEIMDEHNARPFFLFLLKCESIPLQQLVAVEITKQLQFVPIVGNKEDLTTTTGRSLIRVLSAHYPEGRAVGLGKQHTPLVLIFYWEIIVFHFVSYLSLAPSKYQNIAAQFHSTS